MEYKPINQLPGIITVKVVDEIRQTLLRLESRQAKEILGIFVSMDDNSTDQVERLLGKTRQMAKYFRSSKVEKNETWCDMFQV